MTENGVDSFIVALLSLAFHSVLAYQVASAQSNLAERISLSW